MSTLFKHRNEIVRFVLDLQEREKNLSSNFSNLSAPEKILWEEVQNAILPDLVDTFTLLETGSRKLMDLREQVKPILTNSGHCDPADLYPHLDKGNQDQIVILNMILEGIYPNGRENHVVFGSSQNTVKNQNSTNELPNMSLASKVIETEAPKNDIVTVNLNTQDTQLDPKEEPNA